MSQGLDFKDYDIVVWKGVISRYITVKDIIKPISNLLDIRKADQEEVDKYIKCQNK